MKQLVKMIMVMVMLGWLFTMTATYAQDNYASYARTIKPVRLYICTDKTTNLIFNYPIRSADIGSSSIIAQKANGAENILQLKASEPGFKETNISVVTSDGAFYSFITNYNNVPPELNIIVPTNYIGPLKDLGYMSKDARIEYNARQIAALHLRKTLMSDKIDGIHVKLQGIYIQSEALYFRLKLENESKIDYDIDLLGLSLIDRKKAKRTALQQQELNPLYTNGNDKLVKAASSQVLVLAIPKFTIPYNKQLIFQMTEKNGGRNFQFNIKSKTFRKLKTF